MAGLSLSGQTKQRQVVILGVGAVLLGGLLLFQLPRTLKMLNPPAAEEETVATPAAPPAVAPPVVPVATTPSPRQVSALVRFKSKDPFVQQINLNGGSGGASAPTPAPSASAPSEESQRAAATSSSAVESPEFRRVAETATISVNGVVETVRVSATFPKGNPVFSLVSLSGETAKVGVAGGKLKGGAQTVTLSEGEPLTLLNTVDGKRYKLELRRPRKG